MPPKVQGGFLGVPDRVVNPPAPTLDVKEIRQQVGSTLARARKALSISQQDIATKLGVVRAVVSRMEAGKRSISVEELPRLAWAYEVDVKTILEGLYS